MELSSPYLWKNGEGSKPLIDDLGITHHGRTETVNRALTDFGIEDSFAQASKRFEEHYGFKISATTVDRVTKASALQAEAIWRRDCERVKSCYEQAPTPNGMSEPMLVELDGCEIRTGIFAPAEADPQDEQPDERRSSDGVTCAWGLPGQ